MTAMRRSGLIAIVALAWLIGGCDTRAQRQAAGLAIADILERGGRMADLAPEHMKWLLGPGGWTPHDVEMLEMRARTVALERILMENARDLATREMRLGRKPRPVPAEEHPETIWKESRGRLLTVARAFRDGDPQTAKARLRDWLEKR